MPFVTTKIDLVDVMPHLTARGYGVHQDRLYAVRLNVPSKTQFRKDGTPYRDLLRGLSKQEVDVILTRAEDAGSAALWIERISLGEEMSMQDGPQNGTAVQGLTAEQIATIIDSRVRLGVQRELELPLQEMAQLRHEMSELVASLRQKDDKPTAAEKKPKAKRGKKLDPNSPEVEEAMKALGIPESLPPA